jgi:hypothetical protein
MAGCNQLSQLSSARLRWATVRKSPADPAHKEEICRTYGSNFFEAVMTRQAASFCGNVIDRHRLLELLDSEIDALRPFPEKAESMDSHSIASQIQGSDWQEASMDGKALFGRFAQTSG